ncbi:MAG: hypothetical protein Kow0077_32750 [Anaerolineae bacterium]
MLHSTFSVPETRQDSIRVPHMRLGQGDRADTRPRLRRVRRAELVPACRFTRSGRRASWQVGVQSAGVV